MRCSTQILVGLLLYQSVATFGAAFDSKQGQAHRSAPQLQERIIGGVEAKQDSAPYQVALLTKDLIFRFSGVILNEDFVMSNAAFLDSTIRKAAVGRPNLKSKDGLITTIAYIIHHPKFNAKTYDYDFALAALKTPLPLDVMKTIAPITLPYRAPNYAEQTLTFTGWGFDESGSSPTKLKVVKLTGMTKDQCLAEISGITNRMICAKGVGKNACPQDQGGPLTTTDNNNNTILVGLHSWSKSCPGTGTPIGFSYVYSVKDWIEETMGKWEHLHNLNKCQEQKGR